MLLTQMIFRQAAVGPDPTTSLLVQLLPMVGIIAIFYFLLIRPQQQRAKKHREMLGALKSGDEVITSGGIIGKVSRLTDAEVTIDTGGGGKLRVVRTMILDVKAKGEPVPANDVKES